MKEKVQEFIEEFNNEAETVKDKAKEYITKGKGKANEYFENSKSVVDQL